MAPAGMEDVGGLDIRRSAAGGKAVLRQADAAGAQVGADLLVLHAVEAVAIEQLGQAAAFARRRLRLLGQQRVEKVSAPWRRIRARWRRAALKRSSSALRAGSRRGVGAQQRRDGESVVAGGHQRAVAGEQVGPGAALVDGEIVDHRVHGEGQGVLPVRAWSRAMMALQALLRAPRVADANMNPMPPPAMPPSIQNPWKLPHFARARLTRVSV